MKELRRVRQDGDSGRADGCVVCAGNPIEVLIEPCGHVAVCKDCVRRMHRKAVDHEMDTELDFNIVYRVSKIQDKQSLIETQTC